jgi:hypothetical protein
MEFQDAVKFIEGHSAYDRFDKIKNVFKKRLKEVDKTDYVERGICYYYLLRIVLNPSLMYDTDECREYLGKMDEAFKAQLKEYKKNDKKFAKDEMEDFFRLMERSYSSLEVIFRNKNFYEEEWTVSESKMKYRKHRYWFKKEIFQWLGYSILETTSMYGHSFVRWGFTAAGFALFMSTMYWLLDHRITDPSMRLIQENAHWYDYIYFSIVTATTLGLGDIVPQTVMGKVCVSVEVFFGFTMLGVFVNLIQKRI